MSVSPLVFENKTKKTHQAFAILMAFSKQVCRANITRASDYCVLFQIINAPIPKVEIYLIISA